MGAYESWDADIMIDSADADGDKADLKEGCQSLQSAKEELESACGILAKYWKGEAAIQCDERLRSFIEQVQELITLADTASKGLDAIAYTYRDADQAVSRQMK